MDVPRRDSLKMILAVQYMYSSLALTVSRSAFTRWIIQDSTCCLESWCGNTKMLEERGSRLSFDSRISNTSEKSPDIWVQAGGSFVKHQLLFSTDSKYIFAPCESVTKVFSVDSGQCVHYLSAENNDSEVMSVCINPKNCLQLISAYQDGSLVFWDYEDAINVKVLKCVDNIIAAYAPPNQKYIYLLSEGSANYGYNKSRKTYMMRINVKNDDTFDKLDIPLQFDPLSTYSEKKVDFGFRGEYVAAVTEKLLTIGKFNADRTEQFSFNIYKKLVFLTCVTCHPEEYCIATANTLGEIFLWYDFLNQNKYPPYTVYHWHSSAVSDVRFSSLGSFFLSGGQESVLVKWLPSHNSKKFLPRMGLPITGIAISKDNCLFAVAHTDNRICILDNLLNVVKIIQGLARGPHWKDLKVKPFQTDILYYSPADCIVTNGKPGHLQFYDLLADTLVYNLDITNRNFMSNERDYVVIPLEVFRAAFDDRCHWLATVEYRNDHVNFAEIRLKFWKFDEKSQSFKLNTNIEFPHLDFVNALRFQPIAIPNDSEKFTQMAVTTSIDKQFKIWSYKETGASGRELNCWICEYVAFFRGLPAGDACFSEDGTVLAVAFESILTLWLPDVNVMKAALSHREINNDIKQVRFGRFSSTHLVVCTTENAICVWNSLTLSLLWHVNVKCVYLSADPRSDFMVLFDASNHLYVFKPVEPKPIQVFVEKNGSRVVAAAFLPRKRIVSDDEVPDWQKESTFVFIDEDQVLHGIAEKDDVRTSPKKVVSKRNITSTLYQQLIAEKQVSDVVPVKHTKHHIFGSPEAEFLKTMLGAQSHVMPPINTVCDKFLKTLLEPHQISEVEKKYSDDDTDGENDANANIDRGDDSDSEAAEDKPEDERIEGIPKENIVDNVYLDEKLSRIEDNSFSWFTDMYSLLIK